MIRLPKGLAGEFKSSRSKPTAAPPSNPNQRATSALRVVARVSASVNPL